ncbi:RagB/SusD family nutrient uptake outer membrane protein [Plebeiibacterium sediminum]|uniref:RagB/SusD family nutrient uptake outer membrane protein n=1 Tax=Plebeiibacterium sediminum TaxID=2992112 RepID=A0AAE3SFV8_9BACT|nr:RagB/SusD family nutrient uptake outer membrane protein [Plebeiobacterium sediminum]MCW3787681.1 RagB/SusD family nutrient uptake outer membrane protein [Plebeiobacterium sediminum]
MKVIYSKTLVKLLFVASMAMTTACSDEFLEKKPYGQFTEDQLTVDNVEDAMKATYSALREHFFGNNESFSAPVTNWIFDVRSDDAYKGGDGLGTEAYILQLELSNITSDNASGLNKWRNKYYAINKVHQAMNIVTSIAPDDMNVRLGELRLMRGHFYFDLIRIFERIPYIDEASIPSETGAFELTREEIFKKIEADFKFAWENLPESNTGERFNKYAAAAYLCKLHMELKNYSDVVVWADHVMEGQYYLYDNFLDMSKMDYDQEAEAVFSIPFSGEAVSGEYPNINWGNLLNMTWSEGNLYGNGDDFFIASQNLANAFRTDSKGLPLFDTYNNENVGGSDYKGNVDPRLDFTMGRIGIPYRGYTYNEKWIRDATFGGFSGKKFAIDPDDPNMVQGFPWGGSGLDYKLIRYSEVLLWKAEALIEGADKNLDEARRLINEVRAKAKRSIDESYSPIDIDVTTTNYKIEEYPSTGWTESYARQALRMERRLELAMEGHRWFDLVRWGVTENVLNTYFSQEDERDYLSGASFSADETYLPIPLEEVDKAGDLYKQ